MTQLKRKPSEQGFTLVELAIVLVIIGLIVGGVLVGQDLIKAAEVRATVGQIEKYNAAVNTFRTRFNGMPGDLKNAADFTGILFAGAGTDGLGDGNRLLTGAGSATAITDATGEITMFWRHLSEAGLVDGQYSDDVVAGGTFATVGTSFPKTKLDRGGIGIYGVGGFNYYQIGATDSTTDAAVYAGNLTPLEAFNIDNKIDDGTPFSGIAVARAGTTPNADYVVAAGTGQCAVGGDNTPDAADRYDAQNANVDCQLRLRMSN